MGIRKIVKNVVNGYKEARESTDLLNSLTDEQFLAHQRALEIGAGTSINDRIFNAGRHYIRPLRTRGAERVGIYLYRILHINKSYNADNRAYDAVPL